MRGANETRPGSGKVRQASKCDEAIHLSQEFITFIAFTLSPSSPQATSRQHHFLWHPNYPMARNQYINNSPGVYSCIRAGANTGSACICTGMNSTKNLENMRKIIPQICFPVFVRVRRQPPHVFKRSIPEEFSPACIGFVPGYAGAFGKTKGTVEVGLLESCWT